MIRTFLVSAAVMTLFGCAAETNPPPAGGDFDNGGAESTNAEDVTIPSGANAGQDDFDNSSGSAGSGSSSPSDGATSGSSSSGSDDSSADSPDGTSIDPNAGTTIDGDPMTEPDPMTDPDPGTSDPDPMTDPGGTDVMTSGEPIIPEISGDCPAFVTGNFNYSGLEGVMDAGPKADGGGALLFYWHGTGGSASNYEGGFLGGIGEDNIRRVTSNGGMIVSVQGAAGSGDTACSGTAVFDGDFSVIDQIVACAVRDHNIDPRRIYATGCSAGGLQSGCMAMRRSDYVAAVAPNSGGLTFPMSPMGSSGHIPASMTMHGGAGDNVFINFGDSSRTFNDVVTSAGGFAVDCNHMSGHCGAPSQLYTAAIEFLFAHPFGVEPSPYESELPSSFPSYCEIY